MLTTLLAGCSGEPAQAPSTAAGSRPDATTTSAATPEIDARAEAPIPEGEDRVVVRIVDGDTIVVDGDEKIRLIGIDTPETKDPRKPVECFGREASAFIESLIPAGTAVRLAYDVERTDRYDRTLAYIYRLTDGLFVNLELAEQGYAQVATYPPNVAHVDEFLEATRRAREAGRGLWSAC